MDIPNEFIPPAFVAAGAAVSVTFGWLTKRISKLEQNIEEYRKRSEECQRDRVLLLKFASRAISHDPALEKELASDLSTTQLIRLTQQPA